MAQVPVTSTTLLRNISSDARHCRWGEFVRRYQPMMEDYLRVHFPGLEAEDIVSETLVALADALKNYRYAPDETGRFHNYLTGILKHKALSRRKMAERHAKSVAAFEDSAKSSDDSAPLAEEQEWKETVCAIAIRRRHWPFCSAVLALILGAVAVGALIMVGGGLRPPRNPAKTKSAPKAVFR